jgi:hypothetical protein
VKVRVMGVPLYSIEAVTEASNEVMNFRVILGVDKFLLHAKAHQEKGYQYLVIDSLAILTLMRIPLLGVRVLSPMRVIRYPLKFPKQFPEIDLTSKILGVKLAISNARRLARVALE